MKDGLNVFFENRQKLVDFEGFRPNGYHHVNQRTFLHRLQWGKIDFGVFLEKSFKNLQTSSIKP